MVAFLPRRSTLSGRKRTESYRLLVPIGPLWAAVENIRYPVSFTLTLQRHRSESGHCESLSEVSRKRGAANRVSKMLKGEIPTWTLGFVRYPRMGGDPFSGNSARLTKKSRESGQGCELLLRWASRGKVPDQANTDSVLVVIVPRCLAMRAVLLFMPSWSHFDKSVRGLRPVAYHEVVSQLIPTVGTVMSIKRSCPARRCGTVMNHDVVPSRTDRSAGRKPGSGTNHRRTGDARSGGSLRRARPNRRRMSRPTTIIAQRRLGFNRGHLFGPVRLTTRLCKDQTTCYRQLNPRLVDHDVCPTDYQSCNPTCYRSLQPGPSRGNAGTLAKNLPHRP